MNIRYRIYIGSIVILLSFMGCGKFLGVAPDKQLVIPRTLDDLQAVLDFDNGLLADPGAGQMSSDDGYLTEDDLAGLFYDEDRRLYRWEKEGVFTEMTDFWRRPYRQVYYANVVLKTLEEINSNNEKWDNIKGQALFLRARGLLSVASIWAEAYDPTRAEQQLGIPVRTDPDYNIPSTRGSLAATYQQIIGDLEFAKELLPTYSEHINRASRTAALGLLARVYLMMGDYPRSLQHADECLALQSQLIDYNDMDSLAAYPFEFGNQEVIFNATLSVGTPFFRRVDTTLYALYTSADLRKKMFFNVRDKKYYSFKGSYNGDNVPFSGIAVNEIYLIRAESNARLGNHLEGLQDLNYLLSKRHIRSRFKPLEIENIEELINQILTERRKELVFRNLRWPDIKRLNREGAKINLLRVINGITYELRANDPRFVLPIPDDIIEMTDMPQNP